MVSDLRAQKEDPTHEIRRLHTLDSVSFPDSGVPVEKEGEEGGEARPVGARVLTISTGPMTV